MSTHSMLKQERRRTPSTPSSLQHSYRLNLFACVLLPQERLARSLKVQILVEHERQHCFRGNFDLLALGQNLCARTTRCSNPGTDRGTLSASYNRADDGTDGGTTSDHCCGTLVRANSVTAALLIQISRADHVTTPEHGHLIHIKCHV